MQKVVKRVFDKKGVPVLIGIFALLFVAETVSSLRPRSQKKSQRLIVNSLVALPAFFGLRLLLLPVMVLAARQNCKLNSILRPYSRHHCYQNIFAFIFLDYSNYLWHVLNHKIEYLWKFHLVHHTDLELDVTTALRFHIGEIFTSLFYRTLAVLLSRASATTVLIYEVCFEAATQFHHSNWKLPLNIERTLNKVIVTPRMHGIHHNATIRDTDSNYSVIFSVWDRIHNTFNSSKNQDKITIGAPGYPETNLSVLQLLQLPFTKEKTSSASR
jgi:sterol desaturase/sphingolipid hydroxylase (fatty acid hydroxylase superfamily)